MKGMTRGRPAFSRNYDKLLWSLPRIAHLRQALEGNKIIIRFENGYGAGILPVLLAGDEEIFEMLVLSFYGAGINDYKIAQYVPIPELNCGNFEEIIVLCQQVALLPKSHATLCSADQSQLPAKGEELEKCRSNLQ